MSGESKSHLLEIQMKLDEREDCPDDSDEMSDMTLQIITDAMEGADEILPQALDITVYPKGRVEIFIGENRQLNLASLLPTGVKFVASTEFSVNIEKGELRVPVRGTESQRRLSYWIKLAHEIAHFLDPERNELDLHTKEYGTFDKTLIRVNARMKMEANAWNYGLAVGAALGVDEVRYEDIAYHALRSYHMNSLELLALQIEKYSLQDTDQEITVFNPITQDMETTTIHDFYLRVKRLAESGDLYNADAKVKRAAIR